MLCLRSSVMKIAAMIMSTLPVDTAAIRPLKSICEKLIFLPR